MPRSKAFPVRFGSCKLNSFAKIGGSIAVTNVRVVNQYTPTEIKLIKPIKDCSLEVRVSQESEFVASLQV